MSSGLTVGPKCGAALLAAITFATAPAVASPRFFASTAQCESAHVLAAGACRTAFANAMAEFAAKAPTFHSRRACFKGFGPCMPWPIGTRRFDTFRPQWIGATIDDASVLPAIAPGRIHFAFTPQSAAVLSSEAEHANAAPAAASEQPVTIMSPDPESEAPSSRPSARPGSGFTVIDGVLTYPAPARFQPKNLKHP